jgi:putative hydrolase of the HAD superfamily
MGWRKPEPEAFEHVSREIGVPLERILFLDDTVANLEGARALGMKTVHVRSPRDVVRALSPWLDSAPL